MAELNANGAAFTDLVREVFRVNGLLLRAGDELTRPVGLSSARWQVLGVVGHSPIPVAHVARVVGLTRQSVQQTADALAKDGFITYLENPHHHRAKLMQVTPKGYEALTYIAARQAARANSVGGNHDLESLRAALEMLREVRGNLERDTPILPEKNA